MIRNSIKLDIGGKIRQFRLERNWSQLALAIEVGLSQREISKIENNEISLKVDILDLISKILNKSIHDFFFY